MACGTQVDPQNTLLYRRSVSACGKDTLRSREGWERDRDPRPPGRSHSAPRNLRRRNPEQETLLTNTSPHSPIRTRTTAETLNRLGPGPLPPGDSGFGRLCREDQMRLRFLES